MRPTIGIIGGRGILGKVFRKAFEDAGFDVLISGRKPDDKKVLSTKKLVEKSDIVIVSVFLRDTEKVLTEIVPRMRKNQLLADFTSVKEVPLKIMQKAKSEVVGLHPMFGEVKSLAGENLFACKIRGGKLWKILRKTFENLGLKIHEVSAKKHDELATVHQAAAHLSSLAFALLLKKKKILPAKLFEISSPSTQLTLLTSGRILAQDLEMYTDIQLKNPQAAVTAVELAQILAELAFEVAGEERKSLLKSFKSASNFFDKWSAFATAESGKIFEKISPEEKVLPTTDHRLPTTNSIATFGQNSQTELAAHDFLKKQKLFLVANPSATIAEVFEKVAKNKAKIGFIPLENFSIGPVRETMRALFEARSKIQIFAEFERRIEHSLLAAKKIPLRKIQKVFAHPQAAAQSAKFLRKNLPRAEIIEVTNAGEAIERARQEEFGVAISSAEFAKAADVKIVKKGIEDDAKNRTRFIAITKSSSNRRSKTDNSKKTALAFFFRKNKAGQLAAALDIFAEKKINLSRIESIPTEKKQGEFFFFTECEKSPKLPIALKKLTKVASVVDLGSY